MRQLLDTCVCAALAITLLLGAEIPSARAQAAVDFLGEHYEKRSEDLSKPDDKFADFSAGKSARQFTFHHFLNSGNEPVQAAASAAKYLKEKDPTSRSAMMKNQNANQAMLDFLFSPKKSDDMEFHVLKYAPAPEGKGMVAAEYRYAFKLGELDADEVKKLRMEAVNAMAKFDTGRVSAYFNLQ